VDEVPCGLGLVDLIEVVPEEMEVVKLDSEF
jgi:hypothetical protein